MKMKHKMITLAAVFLASVGQQTIYVAFFIASVGSPKISAA